jgi:hypothetical protein
MGLCIQLTDEVGTDIETVADDTNILHRLLPPHDDDASPMLASIDWYGDTVFNAIQMKRFLAEWERIVKTTRSPQEQTLIAAIKRMAERCQDEAHHYLKFIGD